MKKAMLLTVAACLEVLSFATPAAAYDSIETGEQCREFTREIYIGGKKQQGYGTACLQDDGSWAIQGDETAPDNQAVSDLPEYELAENSPQRVIVTPPRVYRSESNIGYGVGVGSGSTSFYYSDGYPAYYYPYHRGHYRWGRNHYRDHFHHHHHGPGWHQHWKHHQRSLRD